MDRRKEGQTDYFSFTAVVKALYGRKIKLKSILNFHYVDFFDMSPSTLIFINSHKYILDYNINSINLSVNL